MAHVIEDRVLEVSTSTGTGVFTLSGAIAGFRRVGAVCSVSDTLWYYIEAIDADGTPTGEYEYGLGTYSASNELTRTDVRGSSNAGSVVAFATGSKLVGIGVPAPNNATVRAEWRAALAAVNVGEQNAFTRNQRVAPVALTPGSTVNVDASLSNNFTLVADQNFTLANPSNLANGMVLNFRIKQDATGSRVITWGSKYKFPGGIAGVLSTAANAVDFMSCYYDSTDDTLACVLSRAFA